MPLQLRHIANAILACALMTTFATAAETTTFDRSIRRQPNYSSDSPQYCLLLSGSDELTRTWLVMDDDVLYVDRNGNGDLTDRGERIELLTRQTLDDTGNHLREVRFFDCGNLAANNERQTKTRIQLVQSVFNRQFSPQTQRQRTIQQRMRTNPHLVSVSLRVGINDGHWQQADVLFASTPEAAPDVRFGGDFTLKLSADPQFVAGGEECELLVAVGSRGIDSDTFATLEHDNLPEDLHPVAEIEFRSRLDGAPIVIRTLLDEHC